MRHLTRFLAICLVAVELTACDKEVSVTAVQRSAISASQETFAASDAALHAAIPVPPSYVAGSRKAEADAALAELLATLTPAGRSLVMQSLDPQSHVRVAQFTDPHKARLFDTVSSIRGADIAAAALEKSRAAAKRRTLNALIALVDPIVLGSSRVRVVRDPRSAAPELVLLRSVDANPEDVGAGVAVLYRTRHQYGDEIQNALRVDVGIGSGALSGAALEEANHILAVARASSAVGLPGYGQAQLAHVRLDPLRP